MEFKIGCDPELFLKKDGKFVSAYGLIKGTKEEPLKVDGGAVQVDGMALEFNIDPASTAEEFSTNINNVIAQLRAMVPPEYEFVFSPVAEFGTNYIKEQPELASRLGCEPDFNAWKGGKANPVPDASKSFRTASGHIHIGWTENQDINDPEHIDACCMMVKQLDAILGISSLLWDKDKTRRELYGKAGAFRPKSYGVEYRVLSNAWLIEPWMIDFVYRGTKYAFDKLLNGQQFFKDDYIVDMINRGDDVNAYSNVAYYWPDVPNDLYALEIERKEALRKQRAVGIDPITKLQYDMAAKYYEDMVFGIKENFIIDDPLVRPVFDGNIPAKRGRAVKANPNGLRIRNIRAAGAF